MRITVRVKPGSKKGPLVDQEVDGSLVVYVREPAVEGKANDAIVKILAKHFGVPRSKMQLVTGHKSRLKRFEIALNEE